MKSKNKCPLCGGKTWATGWYVSMTGGLRPWEYHAISDRNPHSSTPVAVSYRWVGAVSCIDHCREMIAPSIYIDCGGTLDNAHHTVEQALQAVLDLGEHYPTSLCSGAPECADVPAGVEVLDKFTLLARAEGNYLVDDDPMVRLAWERLGGHAVDADELLAFAERMLGR